MELKKKNFSEIYVCSGNFIVRSVCSGTAIKWKYKELLALFVVIAVVIYTITSKNKLNKYIVQQNINFSPEYALIAHTTNSKDT